LPYGIGKQQFSRIVPSKGEFLFVGQFDVALYGENN